MCVLASDARNDGGDEHSLLTHSGSTNFRPVSQPAPGHGSEPNEFGRIPALRLRLRT